MSMLEDQLNQEMLIVEEKLKRLFEGINKYYETQEPESHIDINQMLSKSLAAGFILEEDTIAPWGEPFSFKYTEGFPFQFKFKDGVPKVLYVFEVPFKSDEYSAYKIVLRLMSENPTHKVDTPEITPEIKHLSDNVQDPFALLKIAVYDQKGNPVNDVTIYLSVMEENGGWAIRGRGITRIQNQIIIQAEPQKYTCYKFSLKKDEFFPITDYEIPNVSIGDEINLRVTLCKYSFNYSFNGYHFEINKKPVQIEDLLNKEIFAINEKFKRLSQGISNYYKGKQPEPFLDINIILCKALAEGFIANEDTRDLWGRPFQFNLIHRFSNWRCEYEVPFKSNNFSPYLIGFEIIWARLKDESQYPKVTKEIIPLSKNVEKSFANINAVFYDQYGRRVTNLKIQVTGSLNYYRTYPDIEGQISFIVEPPENNSYYLLFKKEGFQDPSGYRIENLSAGDEVNLKVVLYKYPFHGYQLHITRKPFIYNSVDLTLFEKYKILREKNAGVEFPCVEARLLEEAVGEMYNNNVKEPITVRDLLLDIGAKCVDGKLVDVKGQEIHFYRRYIPGIASHDCLPEEYRILELKLKYPTIELPSRSGW